MSTETSNDLPSVDQLAEGIYSATSATALTIAYDRLPESAHREYRNLVRHAQAVELRLQADHFARVGYRSGADMLVARADELGLLGGDA